MLCRMAEWQSLTFGQWKMVGRRVDLWWRGTRSASTPNLGSFYEGSVFEVGAGSIYLRPELTQDENAVSLRDFLRALPPTQLPVVLSGASNSPRPS